MSGLLSRTEIWVAALAILAFLALYWVFRGAPVGQSPGEEGTDSPRASYRDRVIATMVVGLLLILVGAYIAVAQSLAWSIPVFALGFGTVLTLITLNQRHRHSSPTLKRTIELSSLSLHVVLVAGVLIVLNVLIYRYGGHPLDLTRERTYSLESLTLNRLKTLEQPVRFTLVAGRSPLASLQSERVLQLLDLYKQSQPDRIQIQSLDPYRQPEQYEALAKRVSGLSLKEGGGILIEYGEPTKTTHSIVRFNELFDLPASGRVEDRTALYESTFHGESAITSALISLSEGNKPHIYFVTGHGEPSIDESRPQEPGLGTWRGRLTATGSFVSEINLLDGTIPEDASLLVIVAPKSPYRGVELAKLRAFMDKGSPVLFLLGNRTMTGLNEILKSFNVEFGKGTVVDPRFSMPGRPEAVYVPVAGTIRHPVIDSLFGQVVFMPSASPIRVLGYGGSAPANDKVIGTPLLRTTNFSWSDSNPDQSPPEFDQGTDERGPAIVGVAVSDRAERGKEQNRQAKPRLVLFSSPRMAENDYLREEAPNQDLLMNAVAWLRGRADLQGVAPRKHTSMTLLADRVLQWRLIMVPTVMAGLLILGFGISTYLTRRE